MAIEIKSISISMHLSFEYSLEIEISKLIHKAELNCKQLLLFILY